MMRLGWRASEGTSSAATSGFKKCLLCPLPGTLVGGRWRLSKSQGSFPTLPLPALQDHPPRAYTWLPPPTVSLSLQKRLWEQEGVPLCFLFACLLAFLLRSRAFGGQEVGRLAGTGEQGTSWTRGVGCSPAGRWGWQAVNSPWALGGQTHCQCRTRQPLKLPF